MEGQDNNYRVNPEGYYGTFGGAYVPEILHRCVEELRESYLRVIESEAFMQEFSTLLRDYAGRPSPLYHAARMSERYGCRLYLKREDLNHTGSHKINNALGQVLLARHLGRRRVIAETGAGQHGVAVATVCALMGMECMIYMGRTDTERQRANVEKIRMLGGEVTPVESGNMTLKDATNEAIRDWCRHPSDTYYVIGSTVGPHPYPDLVARLQSVIGREIRWQLQEHEGRDRPDCLMAWAEGATRRGRSIRSWTMSGCGSYWPRLRAAAWRVDGVRRRFTWVCRASSTAHGRWSCRTMTDRSRSLIRSPRGWTIRASDRCTPTSLPADGRRWWP